ncbi:hypothetical protein RHMOL_Rhmol13G0286300 [Rhododendron molle]|uniref:Uncharacterized protein n=1 Tax=Rhododendron molle TaxID=49168 RepID=A0ACC0LDC6_RHOML|nr:hypothetical protein RHMOL_Rhmol13G0286300 [Rhododendron molle]
MCWNFLKQCGEPLEEVEAHCDALLLRESKLLRFHQQPPADLLQDINAVVQARWALRRGFWSMIHRARFHKCNAILLHCADVRAVHRAMRRVGQGHLFWYRVSRIVETNIPSIRHNTLTRGFPLAPGGYDYGRVFVETGPNGMIFDLGHHPFGG